MLNFYLLEKVYKRYVVDALSYWVLLEDIPKSVKTSSDLNSFLGLSESPIEDLISLIASRRNDTASYGVNG